MSTIPAGPATIIVYEDKTCPMPFVVTWKGDSDEKGVILGLFPAAELANSFAAMLAEAQEPELQQQENDGQPLRGYL